MSKLSKARDHYINDYCKIFNKTVKYGNATLSVGIGFNSLEVRIQNAYGDIDAFLDKYDLPKKEYEGFKVNYRILRAVKARK